MASTAVEARQTAERNERAFATLAGQLQQLTFLLTPAASPPPPPAPALPQVIMSDSPELLIGTPESYEGDPETCGAYITNCSLLYSLQPGLSSNAAKVAFATAHLAGWARLWGTAEGDRQSATCSWFQSFSEELRRVFSRGSSRAAAVSSLLTMRQGRKSVGDYAIKFRT